MLTIQNYEELNKIVSKEEFIRFFSSYFSGQVFNFAVLKREIQNSLIDKNHKFIPFSHNGTFCGYLVLDVVINQDTWDKLNFNYIEFSAAACRVQKYEINNLNLIQITALGQIQSIANSEVRLHNVYHKIASVFKSSIEFDRASITLIDGESLFVAALFDEGKTQLGYGVRLPIQNTAQEWLVNNKTYYIAGNFSKTKTFIEDNLLEAEGYKSALRVPMAFKGEIIGAINFNSKQPNNFSKYDAEFVLKVADVLSYSIVNTNLIKVTKQKTQEIEKENTRLLILNYILHNLTDANNFKLYIYDVMRKIVQGFKLQGAQCYLFIKEQFLLENEYFVSKKGNEKIELHMNTITQRLVNKEIILDEINDTLYVPIITADKLTGVMVFVGDVKEFFSVEGSFLASFSTQLSIVIANLLLFRSIKYSMEFDLLTGLYNKKKFFSILRREIARSKRSEEKSVLLMIDIDDFKTFNDSYGHTEGDKILASVAHAIKENLRKSDVAGRFGGEEFMIFLPNTAIKDGKELANRLASSISGNTKSYDITVSIGLTEIEQKDDAINFVKRADDALYTAKNKGKNQVVIA